MDKIIGKTLKTEKNRSCRVKKMLGEGGQGRVYEVRVDAKPFALKWYYPQQANKEQRDRLEELLQKGPPNDSFLWPLEMVDDPDGHSFGYIMDLREPRFKDIVDLMKRRVEPSFRTLCTVGYELASSYSDLHTKGLCYRDISFSNVFFDPDTGEIKICDNDNVTVSGESPGGVLGTPRFMAPEIVRGEAAPSSETDLFSLSILLFYIFMLHHPLEGEKEAAIHCFDTPAMKKLYGDEPVFIFDPDDKTNRPVPGYQDNANTYWKIYPQFFRKLFITSFTDGLRDPKQGRVRASDLRRKFVQLRESIVYCGQCGSEVFFDGEKLKRKEALVCWSCGAGIQLPLHIKITEESNMASIVMLNHDTKLYPHHLGEYYNFDRPVAEVSRHPKKTSVWGLKNLTQEKWNTKRKDGTSMEVSPGKSVTLSDGIEINFGVVRAEVKR